MRKATIRTALASGIRIVSWKDNDDDDDDDGMVRRVDPWIPCRTSVAASEAHDGLDDEPDDAAPAPRTPPRAVFLEALRAR